MKLAPLPRFFPLDRTLALSDGVFAVVITLLVLGIEVPQGGALDAAELVAALEKLWHQILIYLVCFCFVAMYWSQQALLFGGLRRMDRTTVLLTLVFLLPVTLLPFVTQLMGTWRDDWEVVAVFACTNLLAGFAFFGLCRHLTARPELHEAAESAMLARRLTLGLLFLVLIMVFGVLLALVDVKAGILSFALMPFVYFLNSLRTAPDPPTQT